MQSMELRRGAIAWVAVALLSACAGSGGAGGPAPNLEDEAQDLLVRYLQIDTTNPPGNEIRGAEFFRELFLAEGIEVQVFESEPGRGNVVARLRGDGSRPAVVLMHHLDVVPADARYWSHDPFSGDVADGYVWGRGALDTKALGIVHAAAMIDLARRGAPLAADLVFLGVADEEAGGALGAGFMVEEHFELFRGAGLVLNEGGAMQADAEGRVLFYGVEAAQKVPFWMRLTATGTPGHGSMPRSDSAANRLVAALSRVAAWRTPLRVLPPVQRFFADTAHLAPPAQRGALADLRSALADPRFAAAFTANLRTNAMVRNTISLTALEGSNKTNVISPTASAELDVRLLPDEDPERFLAELRRVIDDDSIEIETLLSFPPATSPTEGPLFEALVELAAHHHPAALVTTPMAVGFTDCHFFRERGIPCYGFAPFAVTDDDMSRFHGNDERLSVENIRSGARFTVELLERLAGATPAKEAR